MKKEKADLIKRILNMELDMFLAVQSIKPAKCQENPDAFRLVRGSGFESWSYDALISYLEDLKRAKKEGKNLMTLKYARIITKYRA